LNQRRPATFCIFFATALLCGLAQRCCAVSFTDVTVAAGVSYTQWQPLVPEYDSRLYMTGGAAAGDFDGDGWIDLFVTRLDNTDILYRNLGNGTFQDVSGLAGFNQPLQTNGATWGDVDNDGDLDLYVTTLLDTSGRYYLYINDGNGVFIEEAVARGADLFMWSPSNGFSSTFGDYDRDGYLDLFTVEYNSNPGEENSRLLRNLGTAKPGAFEDATLAAGLEVNASQVAAISLGFAPTFADMDRDGHVDLLVVGDFGDSQLFWNNGDGTFTNGTLPAGVGTDDNGMGSAIGDYDGDGDLDWFVSSIYEAVSTCDTRKCTWGDTGNRLYRNNGDRTFGDVTDAAGVREGDWGWGATFLDYDNDGDLDLTHTNGMFFLKFSIAEPFEHDQTRFWENRNGVFIDVATQVGITDVGLGKGLLTFDYDNDGDLDLFIVNNAGQPILYRNDGGNANDWLRVKTVGTQSNADGIGAQITVVPDEAEPGDFLYHEVTAGSNFLGQNEGIAHFGLGEFEGTIDRVTIEWPATGIVQVIEDIVPNSLLTAREPILGVPGDFNTDGMVDAADYNLWQDNLGLDAAVLGGNGSGAATVVEADYLLWKSQFGQSIASGSEANRVPEPSGLLLALLACLARVSAPHARSIKHASFCEPKAPGYRACQPRALGSPKAAGQVRGCRQVLPTG